MKTVLPKDQWPTFEEDREKGRYENSKLDKNLDFCKQKCICNNLENIFSNIF